MNDAMRKLDHPEVCTRIFFPRPDPGYPPPENSRDFAIPVSGGDTVHARLHPHPDAPSRPLAIFFHGNGEIVADYDDVAPVWNGVGASLLAVDYRGYGRSTGRPTPSSLIADAEAVLAFIEAHGGEMGGTARVAVGRSLGSAPAIHLAARHGDRIAALIVESGFARTLPLLRLVGIDVDRLGLRESDGFDNETRMRQVRVPTLLIHADRDDIIPFEEAERNHAACGAKSRELVTIEGAGHNDIMMAGGARYWGAIRRLLGSDTII
jgi:hypothetical protein